MRFKQLSLIAVGLAAIGPAAALAKVKGFNYGTSLVTNQGPFWTQVDYEQRFSAAKHLGDGTFNSARLFTMIQGAPAGTAASLSSALAAAKTTNTSLLLGLWYSPDNAANEISMLKQAMNDKALASLVLGISAGSEDLYRNSYYAIGKGDGAGADPTTIAQFISTIRATIKGSYLDKVPVGHSDVYQAWLNTSNHILWDSADITQRADFLGVNGFDYWQVTDTVPNTIGNAQCKYQGALNDLNNKHPGANIWLTETGWPVNNIVSGAAAGNVVEAEQYWQEVGCQIAFPNYNTWWFEEAGIDQQGVEWGVLPNSAIPTNTAQAPTTSYYSLSCTATKIQSSQTWVPNCYQTPIYSR